MTMTLILLVAAALFIGVALGIGICSVCHAAHDADEEEERDIVHLEELRRNDERSYR